MSSLFCPACGTVLDQIQSQLEHLKEERDLTERDLRSKRSQVARLTKAQADEHPPEFDDAMEIAEYWREVCMPGARELNGPRLANTISRLRHGYDKSDLLKSVWGYSCRPNRGDFGKRLRAGEGGKRDCDLATIMRDATRVDRGIEIAEEELHHDQGLLDDGASRYVATLCDCGHPRADHALFRLHGHDQCLAEGCFCTAFDDLGHQVLARHSRERRTPSARTSPVDPLPAQGALL